MEASRLLSETPSALPAGTRLGEFELLNVLGVGGFGIVYLAFDHALEREVAVKEYMPAALAGRTETMHVTLRSQSDADTFALGLKSFVNEARLLARFDHPSLLKVHRFWEANGTAYMAMPVMRGRTVKEIRLEMVGPPDEAWLRSLLDPLLGAIEKLHSEGVYHRDIAPDNIQIEPGGRPVLLDFGAARRVLSDKSQTLTAILKPAYAPIEQYAEAGAVKQGPWTDIYALGATLHFLLLTRPPPPATTRAVHDEASLLTPQMLPGCSASFLNIIDWMLAPRPSDRPQSVAALRDVLEGRVPPPVRREPVPSVSQWDRTVMLPPLPPSAADAAPRTGAPRPEATVRDDEATLVMPPPAARAAPQDPSVTTLLPAPPTVSDAASPLPPAAAVPPVVPPVQAGPVARPATGKSKLVPAGLGLAAVLAAAFVAVLMWPRQTAQEAPVAQPAASAVAPAPVAAAAVLPPLPAAPESQVTMVTVPAAGNPNPSAVTSPTPIAPPPVDRPAPTATVSPPPAVTAAKPSPTRPTAGNASSTPLPRSPATFPAQTAPPSVSTAAQGANAQAEAPRQPAGGTSQPPVTSAVAEAPKAVLGPEARCSGRNPLSYFVCMERECLRSEMAGHADCLRWRQNAKRD